MPPWQFACPRGHRGIEIGRDIFRCQTCRTTGGPASYPKEDLLDLTDAGDRRQFREVA